MGVEPDFIGAHDVQGWGDRADQLPIRLADVPPIDVELIPSGHHPSGVGEPASTVIAPAVANAVFNAVGARVRHMPISPQAVLEAMKKKA